MFPVIVAREIDMFPAKRRQVSQITGCWFIALAAQVIDGALQIHGIPQNDGRDEQIQTTGTMALVLIGAVPYLAQPVKEYGPPEGVLLFSFVEADRTATTQLGILQPLKSK
jgi:hypothetical protein